MGINLVIRLEFSLNRVRILSTMRILVSSVTFRDIFPFWTGNLEYSNISLLYCSFWDCWDCWILILLNTENELRYWDCCDKDNSYFVVQLIQPKFIWPYKYQEGQLPTVRQPQYLCHGSPLQISSYLVVYWGCYN